MNTHLEFDCTLRVAIIRHIVEKGRAPDVHELTAAYDCGEELINASLVRLHEHHGLVLHPNSHRVWIAHPFSTAPTPFFVQSARGGWWANCAKCALGVAAILGEDSVIHTRLGAENEPLELAIKSDRPARTDLVMHVALPVAHWWDNVLYTCSTILFFRDETQVNVWSAVHGINRGAILPLQQAWTLARRWYGSALDPNWRRKTPHEAAALFDEVGLTGDFWRVPEQWR